VDRLTDRRLHHLDSWVGLQVWVTTDVRRGWSSLSPNKVPNVSNKQAEVYVSREEKKCHYEGGEMLA
jgi:hypothetical protein